MNGIIGCTALLEETKLDEEQGHFLDTIKNCTEFLLSLLNDILDYSKIESGKLHIEHEVFSIKECVDKVSDLFKTEIATKCLEYKVIIDPTVPYFINGDPMRTTQVLINLVSNAVKFTDTGGISVHVMAKIAAEKSSDSSDLFCLNFAVSDTGIGISEVQINRLFQSYAQAEVSTTRKYGGTGLGLAICKKLCHLMGGDITVESKYGIGSTFYFSVVFSAVSQQKSEEIHQHATLTFSMEHLSQFPNRVKNILVVEDNAVNQMVISMMLKKLGYIVDTAVNGQKALEVYQKKYYDLIFMDIQMPILSGYDATKHIRLKEREESKNNSPSNLLDSSIPKHIYIVGLTAFAMPGDKEKCLESGMDNYISKPVKKQDLETVLVQCHKYLNQ